MTRLRTRYIALTLAALLLSACAPLPPAAPQPETQATSAAEAPPAVAPTGRVPLKDAAPVMDPSDVFENFYSLTQVPRASHHEEGIRAFLTEWGNDLGLETIVDAAGNVIIRKPASPGLEGKPGVVLQAHMDMVPQKTPESSNDPLTDPIRAYVEGDWVMADGTTLGADDGIGVAIVMAVLQSEALVLGPIEALFTVNEEDGMDGALNLQPGLLKGSTLINLDSESDDTFTIGSSGGEYATIGAAYAEAPAPPNTAAYTVTVSGLKGGHSGVEINLGRGHATKLLVRFLSAAAGEYGVRVARLEGGTASNAIPREASARVTVPQDQVEPFLRAVSEFEAAVRSELAAVEPDLAIAATPAGEAPAAVMDEKAQETLLAALYAMPQGVMRMSDAVPGLVETSTNMGIVKLADGALNVSCLLRSSVDTEMDDVAGMIESVWKLAGVPVTFSGHYSGWKPNPDSPVLLLMTDVYEDLNGEEPRIEAVHAGLECGTIVSKYPGMDAISIGPNLGGVHTPAERLQVSSVKKLNDFLLETLRRIAEQ